MNGTLLSVWLVFALIVYGADVKIKEGDFGLSNVAAVVTDLLDLPADEHWNESIIEK